MALARDEDDNGAGWLARVDAWRRRATDPSADLVDTEDRRRAVLLAHCALALALIISISSVVSLTTTILFPDPDVSLGYAGTVVIAAAAGLFWVSYRLARRAEFERGAWSTIFTIDAFLFGLGVLAPEYGALLTLGFAVPVACATVFLRAQGTIAVFGLSAILGTAQLAITRTAVVEAGFVIGIVFAVTALTVLIAVLREGDLAQVVRLRALEQADAERLRGELELARRVQLAMLPDRLPAVDGLDLAAFTEPAFEASGDFYDLFELDHLDTGAGPALGVVVCDVAGKGVASALIMSATRAALRAEAERSPSLEGVLAKVNETLVASVPPGLFVTISYAVFDPGRRTLRYASAGHPHPLRWSARAGTVTELESFGLPLGLLAGSTYQEHSVTLEAGDVVMLFTDGLVEALDGERAMYGFDRVTDAFATQAEVAGPAAHHLDGVLTAMRGFVAEAHLEDDVTVVMLAVPSVIDLNDDSPTKEEERAAWASDR